MSNAKSYHFEIKTEKKTKNGKTMIEKTADYQICGNDLDSFCLEWLADFLDGLQGIINVYKRCIREELWCEIELSVGEYDVFGSDCCWTQTKYDRWTYMGYPANDDGFRTDDNTINIYLSPDTKYTDEHHDILISTKSVYQMIRDLEEL